MSLPISPAAFQIAPADYPPLSHETGLTSLNTDDQITAFLRSTGNAPASFGAEDGTGPSAGTDPDGLAVAPVETTDPGSDAPNPVHGSIDDDIARLLLEFGSSIFAWRYLADATLIVPPPAIMNEFIARENEIELANLRDQQAAPNQGNHPDGGDGGGGGDGWGFDFHAPRGLPPVREIVLNVAAFVLVAVATGIVVSGWVEDYQDAARPDDTGEPDTDVPYEGGGGSGGGIVIVQPKIAPASGLTLPVAPFLPHDAEDFGALPALQEMLQQWSSYSAPTSSPALDSSDFGDTGDSADPLSQVDPLVLIGSSAGA